MKQVKKPLRSLLTLTLAFMMALSLSPHVVATTVNTPPDPVLNKESAYIAEKSADYMLDNATNKDRLKWMASDDYSYIEIPATAEGSITDYLYSRLTKDMSIYPGGRDSVLRDVVSKYFIVDPDYIPPSETVMIKGVEKPVIEIERSTDNDGVVTETIVWNIGDIYKYPVDEQPTIKIPLILKEEYRLVENTTYYPTNADDREPPLTDKDSHYPDAEHGAELDYTDPKNVDSYDTIKTPKLPVYPPKSPEKDPDPITVTLPGVTKRVSVKGGAPEDETFQFVLTGEDDAPMPDKTTVTVTGNGSATFGSATFTEEGTYRYTIYEVNTAVEGYTYDTAVYGVTVTITKTGKKLTSSVKLALAGDSDWTGTTAQFLNEYNPPKDPPPPVKETLTVELRKVLRDENDNLVGTGKIFVAQLLDEDGKVVAEVRLPANGDAVKITGLSPDTVYSIREMEGDKFTVQGYDIEGVGRVDKEYIIFKSSPTSEESYGVIRITLNNLCRSDDVEDIPEPSDPSFPEIPDGEDVITIDPEEVPLIDAPEIPELPAEVTPPTGDNSTMWIFLAVAIAALVAIVVLVKANDKTKRESYRHTK